MNTAHKLQTSGLFLLRKSKPHDVSQEPRDAHGQWLEIGAYRQDVKKRNLAAKLFLEGQPIAHLSGHEFEKGQIKLTDQVLQWFHSLGDKAHNDELGDVLLDKDGIKTSIAHGLGRLKSAAFAAVPDVIERGIIIDKSKNWKDRGYNTALLGAPIQIGTERYVAFVVVKQADKQRFHLHEVFLLQNLQEAAAIKTGTSNGINPTALPGAATSGDILSIALPLFKSKTEQIATLTNIKPPAPNDGFQKSEHAMLRHLIPRLFILRKSQLPLFDPHHVAYVRHNRSGAISNIKAKGAPRQDEQQALDFSAPPPEPKGPQFTDEVSHTAFIANGKTLFDHITGFDKKSWEAEHKRINARLKEERSKDHEHYKHHADEYNALREKIKAENPDMERIWDHPELKAMSEGFGKKPEVVASRKTLSELGDQTRAHNKAFDTMQKQVLAHFSAMNDIEFAESTAQKIGRHLKKAQQKHMVGFYAVAGRHATTGLWTAYQEKKGFRACANDRDGSISLAENDTMGTVWHECAHHIEFSHREIRQAATHFRNARAKKDDGGRLIIKRINEIDKTKRYKQDETAVMDKFISTYVGKTYIDGSTEVISMGMGMLATAGDFRKAVEKDPEFLHFTLGMLHYLNRK